MRAGEGQFSPLLSVSPLSPGSPWLPSVATWRGGSHSACCTQLREDLAPPRDACLWKSLPPSAEAGSGARGPRGGP